jgi:hypothetical protein
MEAEVNALMSVADEAIWNSAGPIHLLGRAFQVH